MLVKINAKAPDLALLQNYQIGAFLQRRRFACHLTIAYCKVLKAVVRRQTRDHQVES